MSKSAIRDSRVDDSAVVLHLNEVEVAWTSPMDAQRLAELASLASYYRVVEFDGQVAGFLIAMGSDRAYENDNMAWFRERYRRFLYIDRVVIDAQFAGRELGRLLYEDVFAVADQAGFERVVCEFNWEPRNEASERFHERLGFRKVGQRQIPGGTKVVSMQCRELL